MKKLLELIRKYGYYKYRAGFSEGKGKDRDERDSILQEKWTSKSYNALHKIEDYIKQWTLEK